VSCTCTYVFILWTRKIQCLIRGHFASSFPDLLTFSWPFDLAVCFIVVQWPLIARLFYILNPEVSVSYWHLSSFLIGLSAGLVVSFVTIFGFKLWM